MKILLESDFLDYYDHHFATRTDFENVYYRHTKSGVSRVKMFHEFEVCKFKTPVYGTPQYILNTLECNHNIGYISDFTDVVVYHDIHTHRGEGKEKMPIKQAIQKHPESFCSEFIPTTTGSGSVSLRHLRVGKRQFWIKYISYNDWRSNYGDGECSFTL